MKLVKIFLDEHLKRDDILGILITGSFAKGIGNKDSDLDILIIVSNKNKYRERGNVIIDNTMVEYYVNTYCQVKKYLEIDAIHNNPMMCIALLEGKILYQKYNVLSRLRRYAYIYIRSTYQIPDKRVVEFNKYVLADTLSKMISLHRKKREDFEFVYFVNLKSLYETYARFLGQPVLKEHMLENYFSGNSRFEGILQDFPDRKFRKLFMEALTSKTRKAKIDIYSKLTEYVLDRMGGFQFDGWKLRIPVDYTKRMDRRTRVF